MKCFGVKTFCSENPVPSPDIQRNKPSPLTVQTAASTIHIELGTLGEPEVVKGFLYLLIRV